MTKRETQIRILLALVLALGGIFCLLRFSSASATEADTSGFFSAEYLYHLCASDEKGKETVAGGHVACQAYLAGIVDYHKLVRSLGTAPSVDFCVPNTEPPQKLQNVVWKYLAEHPDNAPFIASPAVALALYETYPCK